MDYKPLIEKAKKKNAMTDYALNKALGYKSVSAIYRIKAGEIGMSVEKLMQLMKLAGKTLSVAAFSTLIFWQPYDVHAATQVTDINGITTHQKYTLYVVLAGN